MTPQLSIRSFSNDQYVLDKVLYSNYYRLKGFPAKNEFHPVVVDIGAHAGYFGFSALSLGARRVYCVEPFPENFAMLIKNLGDNSIDTFIPYLMGINYREDSLPMNYPQMLKEGFFDYANIDINPDAKIKYIAPTVSLDHFLSSFVREKVDLLKISMGYGEVEALETVSHNALDIQNICGEAFIEKTLTDKFKNNMLKAGFVDSRFDPVEGEEGKTQFFFSKGKLTDMFIF